MSVAVRLMCSDIGQNDGGKPAPQVPQPKGLSIKGRTAQIVNGKLVMVDATSEDGVSYPSASPELLAASTSATQNGEAPVASTSRASTPSPSSKTTASRPKLQRRQTRYFCTWEGCLKSYAKPVRLEEHLRSHTGERPYKCSYEGCGASYLRDTHLVAHMRTHLDEKDKPFKCEVGDCDKKFWTNQHLNRHVKLVHEQNNGAYKCEQCDAAFNKHNKLREHIVKEHMPEGTKPFYCPVEGCGKSFQTSSTLRTHSKLHDENRYVCMHPCHLAPQIDVSPTQDTVAAAIEDNDGKVGFPHFATWSALQEHNKLYHPPTCPYAECHGRIFKNNKKLRKHCIKVHLQTLPQSEEETATAEEDVEGLENGAHEAAAGQHAAALSIEAITEDNSAMQKGSGQLATLEPTDASALLPSEGSQKDCEETQASDQRFGGTSRKRKSGGSTSDQLIPTQPVIYQAFDGLDDYEHTAGHEDDPENILSSNKRVRFA